MFRYLRQMYAGRLGGVANRQSPWQREELSQSRTVDVFMSGRIDERVHAAGQIPTNMLMYHVLQ